MDHTDLGKCLLTKRHQKFALFLPFTLLQDFTALAVQGNKQALSLRPCNRKYADVNKLYLLVNAGRSKGEYLDAARRRRRK